jgi:BASS family bile acid:Na+ symporter
VLNTQFFSAFLLPATLALIMVALGLSLTRGDFVNIVKRPRGLVVGLFLQMVALPFLAFLIVLIIPGLSPELKVGIILLAACPGGATSNLVNYLLNGNLALSVSITTVNSFITQFTIPLYVNLGLYFFMNSEADINLPIGNTILQILFITVIPAIVGIYLRSRRPDLADKFRVPLKYITTSLLAVAMIGAIFLEKNEQLNIPIGDYWMVLPLLLLLHFGSMFMSFYTAKATKLGFKSQTTIAIEVGLQNTGLAIAVATGPKMLDNPAFAIPAAIYALFSFFTTFGFGVGINWKQNKKWFRIK